VSAIQGGLQAVDSDLANELEKYMLLQSKIILKNWWTLLHLIPNFKIVSYLWHMLRNLAISAMGTK